MLVKRIVILIIFFALPLSVRAQTSCHELFLSSVPSQGVGSVDDLIKNLAHLRLKLDLAQAQGIINPQVSALRSQFKIKEAELIRYVDSHQLMTRAELFALMVKEIAKAQRDDGTLSLEEKIKKEDERKAFEDLSPTGEKILFHRIEKGSFMMGHKKTDPTHETIEKSFQLAITSTTQIVWRQVLEAARHQFPGHFSELPSNPSSQKGDLLPVDNITYIQVERWLEALNMLASAADPIVNEIMPGHRSGDIYRLPTEIEWEFVARDRGRLPSAFVLGDILEGMDPYIWSSKNAGRSLQPVATRQPMLLSGGAFFDIYGNSGQWVTGPHSNLRPAAIIRGSSSYFDGVYPLRWTPDPDVTSPQTGFRLARENEI
jgi:formylglycine-generating enzyme required for sulfatase activity